MPIAERMWHAKERVRNDWIPGDANDLKRAQMACAKLTRAVVELLESVTNELNVETPVDADDDHTAMGASDIFPAILDD
jgi:hypothetical protein